jgi:hypothetical protein
VQPSSVVVVTSLFSVNGGVINVLRYHRTIDAPFSNGANAMRFNPPKRGRKLLERPRIWHFCFQKWENLVEVVHCFLCFAIALAFIIVFPWGLALCGLLL